MNKTGTVIAIHLDERFTSGSPQSEGDFCRVPNQDLVTVQYSEAASLRSQKIHLLGKEPFMLSEGSRPSHRCWPREYGQELGPRSHRALYRSLSVFTSVEKDVLRVWNYDESSMAWPEDWEGVWAAVYLSKHNGPAFVVVLTSVRCLNGRVCHGMDIHIRSVNADMKGQRGVVLDQVKVNSILLEQIPSRYVHGSAKTQTTFPFKSRAMTAQVKIEVILMKISSFWTSSFQVISEEIRK